MARLTSLSSEVLLLIIQSAMADGTYWSKRLPETLSLVNKRLNGLAGTFIFANYKLTLRDMCTSNTCRLTGRWTAKWDDTGVRARLAHLRSKAPCVRRLTLIDGGEPLPEGTPGQRQFGRGPPLPTAVVPELLETLRALRSLQTLSFEGHTHYAPCVAFPEALWEWLAQRGLREVNFGMNFTFGAQLGPGKRVGVVTIKNFDSKSCHAVQLLRPAELTIEYPYQGRLQKLVPYPELRKLDVTILNFFNVRICKSFFDIVNTPGLEFCVYVRDPCEYKFQHISKWRQMREYLPKAFNGVDLTQFNVRRVDWSGATVQSVTAGENPQYQNHIPKAEQDPEDKELEAMYAM